MNDKLFIIDSTSPFFNKIPKDIINWSKIPFHNIEEDGVIIKKKREILLSRFVTYIKKIKKMGYNAISIDELSKIMILPFYSNSLKSKIKRYQRYYKELFSIARKKGLKIFITTDIMFYNEDIMKVTGGNCKKVTALLAEGLNALFDSFNDLVDGIIFRIGESDGVDVKSQFKSQITIKTPEDANLMLKTLLPIFEANNKALIFRTWTVGISKIGDLIWNRKTFNQTFSGIKSDNLIISMKYGEGDFFRYFELNDNFKDTDFKKILELQTRREYEGFGEYPSFVGWEYEKFYNLLKDDSCFSGIMVWCQTGGWSKFRNVTFFEKTSYWNELNTFVTIKIFSEGLSTEKAVRMFNNNANNTKDLILFLKISDEIINNLLYDPEIAKMTLYFNKTRVPPLLQIFWNNVSVNDLTITVNNMLCKDKSASISAGYKAFSLLKKLEILNKKLNLPYRFDFHYDTFNLFYLIRVFTYTNDKTVLSDIRNKIKKYNDKYKYRYNFVIDVGDKKFFMMKRVLGILLREKKEYRLIDRLLFNKVTSKILKLLISFNKNKLPIFVNKFAMKIESFID